MTIFSKTALAALTAGTIAVSAMTAPASAGPISPVAIAPSPAIANQVTADAAPVAKVHWKKKWHSHAKHNRRAAAAGIAGALIGAAIVGAASRERAREPRLSRWERHVIRCERAYRSYDERTDTWIDRRGRVRDCNL